MIVGVPKEVKSDEARVALVPTGARALVTAGHDVRVQCGAGDGSGFSDAEYEAAGATLVPEAADIWAEAELVVKVKEPVGDELGLLRGSQVLFTFLHLAPLPDLTRALLDAEVTAIAYETVEDGRGGLPLLHPMSEVAGRMAVQAGAHFLEKPHGGRGVLLSGVPGVRPGRVTVIGGGVVGLSAARIARGLGARVLVLDVRPEPLARVEELFGGSVETQISNATHVAAAVADSDLVVGAVLIPGAKAPHVVTRDMLGDMADGSVLVDVAVDQGGCMETTRPTTHADPTFVIDGIVHYGVTNMPGAVPRTSTLALTNVTLPHVLRIAGKGAVEALRSDPLLRAGLATFEGTITHQAVAEAQRLPHRTPEDALAV